MLPPVTGKNATNTEVVVQVPANVVAGNPSVTVTTAAKVTTEPRPLEVVSADLVVVGLVEPALVPGEVVHLQVDNFRTRPDGQPMTSVSYTHLRAHETVLDLVCRLLLETKNNNKT
mgnify:CR=1 FL=1